MSKRGRILRHEEVLGRLDQLAAQLETVAQERSQVAALQATVAQLEADLAASIASEKPLGDQDGMILILQGQLPSTSRPTISSLASALHRAGLRLAQL